MEEDLCGQGLEPSLPRDGRSSAALGAIGAVEILEGGEVGGAADGGGQFGGEQVAVDEGAENCILALGERSTFFEAVADRCDLHLVEGAGRFLPIAGDEGHGAPLGEQESGRPHLGEGDPRRGGNLSEEGVFGDSLYRHSFLSAGARRRPRPCLRTKILRNEPAGVNDSGRGSGRK